MSEKPQELGQIPVPGGDPLVITTRNIENFFSLVQRLQEDRVQRATQRAEALCARMAALLRQSRSLMASVSTPHAPTVRAIDALLAEYDGQEQRP